MAEIAHGDLLNAGQDINEARTPLESASPGAIDERANLDDLTAWELAQQGKKRDLALQALQEAVTFDRQALADAKSKGEPFLRLTVALAAHLEHLGDELRRSGQETAGPIYDEARGVPCSAGRHDSDYGTFLFHENALIRISLRFEGQTQPGCPDRSNVLPELAERYDMPVWGTEGQWRLSLQTPHASLLGSTSSAGPMLDIVSR